MYKIIQWWLSINWKTRLISIIVLVVAIMISAFVFVSFMNFQEDFMNITLNYFRDFSILITYEITHLLSSASNMELKNEIEKIYLTTSSLNYLQFFNKKGNLLFSFPADSIFYHHMINLHLDILDLQYSISFLSFALFDISLQFKDSVIDCIIPLILEKEIIGYLRLGLNCSNIIFFMSIIAQDASSSIFVIIWLIFILGAAFNLFTILDPVNELLIGMQNIAFGNFGYNLQGLATGSLSDLVIMFNEMSERLQFYENNNIAQLTAEKAKLESLASTITDGAILLDSELRILLVNQIAIKILHWSNKDLIGHTVFKYLPASINDSLLPILNSLVQSRYFDNKTVKSQELIISLHDESFQVFRLLLSTISIYDYKYLNGVVIIIKDITREDQLNKAKNQFISNVSHELRTPLCNIGSFLETLIDYRHKLTAKQQDQFLHIAYSETKRLSNLVNDILDLSYLESECNYILEPISLIDTVSYIVNASQIIAFNKQVQIIIEVHPTIQNIFGHQSSLCQVFSNLISNSLKFTHKQGKIVIRVYPLFLKQYFNSPQVVLKNVRLEVIDEGIGIQKIFQKQIFDRFMRIENSIHLLKGTGLGLSIVKSIIYKHNSMINIYSEVDIGTSFWFDLCIIS